MLISPAPKPALRASRKKKRVEFPLVRSRHPGTLNLTAERIAEIFEQEDIARYRKFFRRSKS